MKTYADRANGHVDGPGGGSGGGSGGDLAGRDDDHAGRTAGPRSDRPGAFPGAFSGDFPGGFPGGSPGGFPGVGAEGRADADAGWSLVVPLKPLVRAKSRLAAAVGGALRGRLALAFAEDTVAAVLACAGVRDVVVVTDDPDASAALAALGARIVPDPPGGGLNAALAHGARAVRARRPTARVAALNADLPALRPAELARVLTVAGQFPRAFLADAAEIGTTFLSASPGTELEPAFGGASRERHFSSGAVEIRLAGVDSVRRDVDTGEDLAAALALGVGPRTAARWPRTAG